MYENIIRNASYVRKIFGIGKNTFRIYAEGKKERNIIDFNDMEHMALNILVRIEDGKKSIYRSG